MPKRLKLDWSDRDTAVGPDGTEYMIQSEYFHLEGRRYSALYRESSADREKLDGGWKQVPIGDETGRADRAKVRAERYAAQRLDLQGEEGRS